MDQHILTPQRLDKSIASISQIKLTKAANQQQVTGHMLSAVGFVENIMVSLQITTNLQMVLAKK